MLSLAQITQLICFSMLLASGQVLFKITAGAVPPIASLNGVMALFLNVWFWAALVLYASATLLWIVILQNVPLSQAYPFVALGFVFVPLASWLLFKETLDLYYIGGVALIIAGLGLITVLGSK